MNAAEAGKADILRYLVANKANVDKADHAPGYHQTALMCAAMSGSVDCTQLLIKAGADLDARNAV
jgi:ankyrin repeat protein